MDKKYGFRQGNRMFSLGSKYDMILFFELVEKYCHIEHIELVLRELQKRYIKYEDVTKLYEVFKGIEECFGKIETSSIEDIGKYTKESTLDWGQETLQNVFSKFIKSGLKSAKGVQWRVDNVPKEELKFLGMMKVTMVDIPYYDWFKKFPQEVFDNLTDSDEPLWMWDVDRLEKLMKAHNPIYKDAHYATYTLDNDAKEFYKHLYSGLLLNDPDKMESLRDTVKEKYESDLTKIYQSSNNWAIKDLLIHIVQDSKNEIFSEILTDALHSPNYWSKITALRHKEGLSVYKTYFDNREISEEKVDKRVKEYIAQDSSTKKTTAENKIENISEEEVNKLFRLIHKEEIIPTIKGKEFIQQIKEKNIDIDKALVWKYSFLDESKAALNLQWFQFRNRGYDLVDLSIDSFDNKLKKDIWKLTISKKEKHTLESIDRANTKMYDFAFEERIGEYIGVSLD